MQGFQGHEALACKPPLKGLLPVLEVRAGGVRSTPPLERKPWLSLCSLLILSPEMSLNIGR
jgi:hypothetical protein